MTGIDEIMKQYTEKTPKSAKLHAEAASLIQGGVASPFRYYEPYPFFVERGKGCRLWDVDGNEYLDFNNCYGAIIAGHANPEINRAIQEQAEKGTMFGIPGPVTEKLLKELDFCDLKVIDASDKFFNALQGVIHPEKKRRAHE